MLLVAVSLSVLLVWGAYARGQEGPDPAGLTAGEVRCETVSSQPGELVLRYTVPAPSVSQWPADGLGDPITRVILPDCYRCAVPQRPFRPAVVAKIALPPGCMADDIAVEVDGKTTLTGQFTIERRDDPYVLLARLDEDVENPSSTSARQSAVPVEEAYPGSHFRKIGVHRRRGVSILILHLYPIQYDPRDDVLSFYDSLTVRVALKLGDESATAGRSIRYRADTIRPLEDEIDNPDVLGQYAAKGSGSQPASSRLCDPQQVFDFVVITGQSLVGGKEDGPMAELVRHKQAMGFKPTVVTIEDIYANYEATDQPERIRSFIIDAYNNWGTDFILLAGDTDIVPARMLCSVRGSPEVAPCDIYYQCLDGSYDDDRDGLWAEASDGLGDGEIDLMAEVYLGRVPAENTTELANWVAKAIVHDRRLVDRTEYSALMAGGYLGMGGILTYAKPLLEEIRLGSNAGGYRTHGFVADERFSVGALYDEDRVSPTYSRIDLLPMMNAGLHDVYSHCGHASQAKVMKLRLADIEELSNEAPFFVYSMSCFAGDFTQDCVAEHFTTRTPHGAHAALMFSGRSWGTRYTTVGYAHRMTREFWDALCGEGIRELGAMHADAREDNLWRRLETPVRAAILSANLFGDPSTCLTAPKPEAVGDPGE